MTTEPTIKKLSLDELKQKIIEADRKFYADDVIRMIGDMEDGFSKDTVKGIMSTLRNSATLSPEYYYKRLQLCAGCNGNKYAGGIAPDKNMPSRSYSLYRIQYSFPHSLMLNVMQALTSELSNEQRENIQGRVPWLCNGCNGKVAEIKPIKYSNWGPDHNY